MSEYIVELDGKHSIALKLAFVEEMHGGDFVRGEIVRCRDCKHYEDGKNAYGVPRQCLAFGHMLDYGSGFCAWGERRQA